ncbi:toxin 3FTx-Oxy5-like [Syngnathus acus]|uniref:toxin 3FTx-Oxy5-like n=1 Tax=Syngnathus acus TaxID=161584 RepID=UPI001885E3DC|nr:toxin 3FTx-Oxy5-like [Syngnathus acus]
MKTILVALLIFALANQGEALECYCGGRRVCAGGKETCGAGSDACAAVFFEVGSSPSYFKGCSSLFNCQLMNRPGISTAACCTTDLCNR